METINIASLQLAPHSIVLDLGCGEGRHSHASAWHFPNVQTVGVDLNHKDLTCARDKGDDFFASIQQSPLLSYACSDGTQLPFQNQTFDAVICSEVLEHIPDYRAMLDEIQRVLKPGGIFAASVPRAWPERICWQLSAAYHQVEGGHVRIFNGNALAKYIEGLGFLQTRRYYAHALHSIYWWLRCAFWRQGEQALLCRTYHKLLVWDLMKKPALTRLLERLLNPLMGKSTVWHFVKSPAPTDH